MISMLNALAAPALFVSDLQPSQNASAELIRSTVAAVILRHGSDWCAAVVAAEFGDHPEIAVRRMSWARAAVGAGAAAPLGREPQLVG